MMKTEKEEAEREIGTRIMLLRSEKGYTRDYMSEKAGISSRFLYEIEQRGKAFSMYTLVGLASALEVSADYILFGKPNIPYDAQILNLMEKFSNESVGTLKKLLEIAYELTRKEM